MFYTFITCSYPLPMATHITPVRTVPCRRRFWSNPIDIWARVDSPQVVQCHFGVRVRNDGVGVGFGKSQLESCFPFLANLWKMVVFFVKLCTPIKGYQGFCWTLREWKNGSLKIFDFFWETNFLWWARTYIYLKPEATNQFYSGFPTTSHS